ncbi:acyl-CoA synthetase [Kangiella sediminilitoris]|uniref:Acetyl-CoA synthetase n=1 Tax=Kangiella sediminilitoris TaxID=1144748 RepID=A0A1B3BA68_9GAMM|nr:acyl-CoA synthetase [Kangiella sediminilitoris]AOE49644.1 acetyl-CoA synthetase [Kangiella sediminilitoris]
MKYQFEDILQQDSSGKWNWNLPQSFNICEACIDQHTDTDIAHRQAMIIENETTGEHSATYQQLSDYTSQFANLLKSLSFKARERVLIRLPNSIDYPVAFFGCIKFGAVSVPTSTLLSASEVAYLAKDSGATILVTDKSMWPELSSELKDTDVKTVLLCGEGELPQSSNIRLIDMTQALQKQSSDFDIFPSQINDPAYLVYTSGTTGYPKGVLHAQRALLGRLPASRYWFDLDDSSNERIMHSGKFNWTYVLGSALMDPLLHGHTVIAYEGTNDANTWPTLIAKHECSIFIGVPTIYRQIVQKTDYSGSDLPSLKHCMSAGEHLSDEMQQVWTKRFGAPIYEAIGMSEVSYYISQNKNEEVVPGAAGFVQPGHYVDLLDSEGEPVEQGEEGMICINDQDPGLFLEYWQLPEETKTARHDGWFFTGDYARQDEKGYIWFLGRKDDIINTFGFRVSPHEVERVFKAHPGVADCVAVGETIGPDKTLVSLCIIRDPGSTVTEDELIQYGLKHLAKYKAPKKVHFMEDYPRTKNGKVLRKQLIQQLHSKEAL